jgi:hypothetical protein
MRFGTTICVTLVAAALGQVGLADDKAPAPSLLLQVDLNLLKGVKNARAPGAREGDMWQFYLISPTLPREQRLRTLRVEIEGGSAALAAIVKVPVLRRKDGEIDGTKMNISVFIRAVKESATLKGARTAVVKITPVGEDGKDRPTASFRLEVNPPVRPAKKAPPIEPAPDPLPPIGPGR